MLLFSDGFDSFNIYDVRYKWGFFGFEKSYPSYLPEARIVSGTDPSCNKPFATKDGRALYLGVLQGQLVTTFRPSRTLYAGFAFRGVTTAFTKIRITFATKAKIDRGIGRPSDCGEIDNPVGILDLTIYPYYTNYIWTFTGGQVKVGTINTAMDMLSGDYHYIQVGMTLMGNVSALPEAWCEIRFGNRLASSERQQNILTSAPDGAGSFYMNALSFSFNREYDYYHPCYTTVDDFYILNDEGTVNNSFLGNVKVRRALPSAEGADNDAVPTLKYGDARRFQSVDEDFIGSNALPYPQPTPEQDPLFIPWETGFEDYLTLEHRGDRQSLRFHSVPFEGSAPEIYGAVLHGLAMASMQGNAGTTVLKGYKRVGLIPLVEAKPTDVPLTHERENEYTSYNPQTRARRTWQTYPMVFENDEVVPPGQHPQIWNPEVLNDSEWVIELADCELDPLMYDPNLIRFNLNHEEVCSEFLGFVEVVHRFYDALVAESLALVDAPPTYQRTFKIAETLYWSPEISVYRKFHKSINDTIKFAEAIPWIFLFAQGQISFADAIFLEWHDLVEEEIVAIDWSSGFWEELFKSSIDITDTAVASYIERLDEMFGLEEPYLWDGHEDVEETLEINVTYVWDNHELMEEYLYPDDNVMQGIGLFAGDGFGLAEDHFDGWLVEQVDDHFTPADSVLTQHWRYERFFGIVIASWQVIPEEQFGNDGNHDGDNPWGW